MCVFPGVGRRISVQGFQLPLDGNETWWDHSGGNKSWTLELKDEPSLVFISISLQKQAVLILISSSPLTLYEQTLAVTISVMV